MYKLILYLEIQVYAVAIYEVRTDRSLEGDALPGHIMLGELEGGHHLAYCASPNAMTHRGEPLNKVIT